jgi:chemotaxis protein CheD
MIEYTLNIGDVAISSSPASYTCLGLGSCIGLFIQDRNSTLSAAAHIFLPDSNQHVPTERNKFYTVSAALKEILERFKLQGSTLTSLRAKITGGANVINVNVKTGARNAEAVISHLVSNKIYIAATDIGGNFCRTAKFQSSTGQLTVRVPQTNEYKIY